ncbi:HlyD family type I secretion periplasmic adaptor subunit [Aurantimonas endophytica]|uniref:Membrane fusion protein (MFP) family protein n=2 Tax=Aurantimonas endophytica TaxID=1522175 RepID=A0A7W6HFY3_9HYPH|nr:HlyD family type I secretion periplasmic adaptor subunit [Aurantimonas endophytica]MBB4004418.1 HlyD family secretion protein [Aurantimonas endophytica]MCO6405256.1 HlyD family type I secretion periplasmic adaptor subunit [Aurantimonas endophytica]
MSDPQKATGVEAAPADDGQRFGIRSRIVASGLLATFLIVGCGGWAAQASLSGAIIAQGKVTVKKQVKEIQHRDGGIVGAILVANGDVVKAGDVLIRLDETQTKAELGVIASQLSELIGRQARLRAERDGAETVRFDPAFETAAATKAIAEGERRLFADNRATREAQRDQLQSQIEQFGEQVKGLQSQRQSNAVEREMIAEDLDRLAPLVARQLVEGTRTRTMERDLAKIDGLKGEIEANIAQVMGQISEARMKIIELDQQVRTDAQRELRDVDARIAELSERIVAAKDRLSRMDLRAPIDGFVNDLKIHTVNGVIAPGETVMGIVPEGEELVVEAKLAPTDIDQVIVGQDVKLRFSAFNQRTTPEIDGRVDIVGAAATLDPASGQTFYLSTIAITDEDRGLGEQLLVPGMPVEVFLKTGDRSALSYLVKPFSDQMMRSFREE